MFEFDPGAINRSEAPQTLLAVMMHGEVKMRNEGLRTRDAHVIEWLTRLYPDVKIHVRSRAEPWPRLDLARKRQRVELPESWDLESPQPVVLPVSRDRRKWWVKSLRYEETWPPVSAAVVWNPISGAFALRKRAREVPVVFDLLDDWLHHSAFVGIRSHVRLAYEQMFEHATHVTANSEATRALAVRFGRSDAILLPNGCDPDRFDNQVDPHRNVTIGYGGKIGFRIDTELVREAAIAFPHWDFEFVGPVLEQQTRRGLSGLPNIHIVGDVPYPKYPKRLRHWDLAWVPHRVGDGEVGGDVIKTYEYRAAGLPVIMTKIIGWQRALPGVTACDRAEVITALSAAIDGRGPAEVPRDTYVTPNEHTWAFKASEMARLCGLRIVSAD